MTEQFLRQKFQEFDLDQDGFITVQDLKKILQEIARERCLVLRLEDGLPNLQKRISFAVFQGYLQEKISKDSTLYYHSHGRVGHRSTSSAILEAEIDAYETPKEQEVRMDEVLDILSRLDQAESSIYGDFLLRHRTSKRSFSTVSIKV